MSQAGPRRPPDPTSLLKGKKARKTGSCSTPGGSTTQSEATGVLQEAVSPRRGAGGTTQHPSGRTTTVVPVLAHEELPSPEKEPDSTFEDDPEFRLARKQYALLRIHVKEARQLAATLDSLPDLFAEVIQRDKAGSGNTRTKKDDKGLKKDFDGKCEAYMISNTFFPDERDYEVVAAMVMGFGSDANAARRANADLLIQLRDRGSSKAREVRTALSKRIKDAMTDAFSWYQNAAMVTKWGPSVYYWEEVDGSKELQMNQEVALGLAEGGTWCSYQEPGSNNPGEQQGDADPYGFPPFVDTVQSVLDRLPDEDGRVPVTAAEIAYVGVMVQFQLISETPKAALPQRLNEQGPMRDLHKMLLDDAQHNLPFSRRFKKRCCPDAEQTPQQARPRNRSAVQSRPAPGSQAQPSTGGRPRAPTYISTDLSP